MVHQFDGLVPIFVVIDVGRNDGAKNLFFHQAGVGVIDCDQCRLNKPALAAVSISARDDRARLFRERQILLVLLERPPVDHWTEEIGEVDHVAHFHLADDASGVL